MLHTRLPWITLALLCLGPNLCRSQVAPPNETLFPVIPLHSPLLQGFPASGLQAAATCPDTVWIGHASGTHFDVHAQDVPWDFDTDIAGTDSSQGWKRLALMYWRGATRLATDRPEWAFDYGNSVNDGNQNLANARFAVGRSYIKTGVAGVWHSDDMIGVKKDLTNGAETSAVPLSGTRSAWCGLREPGNLHVVDALTGNAYNGDLQREGTSDASLRSEYPGYSNQWDQMMYKDFASGSSGTVNFRYLTDLSTAVDPVTNGSGWFNPDPTTIFNYVNGTADSLMAYAGSPNENAYDTNRRWLSEVLDYSKPVVELFATSGQHPDTFGAFSYTNLIPVSGNIRIVFRVKTNRVESDQSTTTTSGFNSKAGAAMIDDVQVNGGTVYGFETVGSLVARSLIPNLATVGGPWATTGRPPSAYAHIENIANVLYEDLNGAVGSPSRICNLVGNVLVAGDHDNGELIDVESNQAMESPTIDLAVRNGGTNPNGQGISTSEAQRTQAALNFDWYSGFATLNESVFMGMGVRYHAPDVVSPVSHVREWSPILLLPAQYLNPTPECLNMTEDLSGTGAPFGSLDSLKVVLIAETIAFQFGGTNLGNTRGTYFDNVRLGLGPGVGSDCVVKKFPQTEPGPNTGPYAFLFRGLQYQDMFPFNETIFPADNAAFDTTTGLVKSSLNIGGPAQGNSVVNGDSILVVCVHPGDGVATGARLDLIFRIDPGPGNYVVKGDRTSQLIEKDPAHPFWAAYASNCGAWGTGANGTDGLPQGSIDGGIHAAGSRWNKDWWNSCRMDSAEANLWPVVKRGVGLPSSIRWMGTIHEQDPKFPLLGINHNVCFLSDPGGAVDQTNIDCGTPGAVPSSSGYNAATNAVWTSALIDAVSPRKEGTKILPDGYFSPGTHIEYFVRSSTLEDPTGYRLAFDTTRVYPQGIGAASSQDAERFSHVDVLPDFWKSTRFGGPGLACMLMVDAADRRGENMAVRGAADTLGYGKMNGASQGWLRTGYDHTHPNLNADFVAANLGQYGLSFDQYDVGGSESFSAGRLGNRLAVEPAGLTSRQPKTGPSLAMLDLFYNTTLYNSGDLAMSTLHDGLRAGEGSDDVTLLDNWLNLSSAFNHKALWLSGDGLVEDAASSNTALSFLNNDLGTDFMSGNYKAYSTNGASIVQLLPQTSWGQPTSIYGLWAGTSGPMDELNTVSTTGGTEAMAYEAIGPTPRVASVYWDEGPGRFYRTLCDGFAFSRLRGIGFPTSQSILFSSSDGGRRNWFEGAVSSYLARCSRRGPVVGVGDLPGDDAGPIVAMALAAVPNPAPPASPITFRYRLDRAQPVSVHVYSISGRMVARLEAKGATGENTLVWNRRDAAGARVPAGVYFYAIAANGETLQSRSKKMVLLGP